MSLNIAPTWYAQQFATNIALLLQEKGPKTREYVTVGNYVGKQASPVDQVGAVAMQPVVDRFAAMGRVDAPTDRRWVFPSDFDLPQLIDNFDLLRLITDPKSSYVQNAMYAAGRQYDDLVIAAALGTAQTGETGATATTLPAGQVVAVNFGAASNTGLTVAKLREAKRILMTNQVDIANDPLTIILKAKQHDNLLAEAQVISTDFNEKPVLVEGLVTRFMGFNFVLCERIAANGSSQDRVIAYSKSGMHLGIWNDMQVDISERKDLRGIPWQVYLKMTAGATRLEEKKVVEIVCA